MEERSASGMMNDQKMVMIMRRWDGIIGICTYGYDADRERVRRG